MNYKKFRKDNKLKQKDISKSTGYSLKLLTRLQNDTFKGVLSLHFFLCLKRDYPEIDLKPYFPEYKELIELEIENV